MQEKKIVFKVQKKCHSISLRQTGSFSVDMEQTPRWLLLAKNFRHIMLKYSKFWQILSFSELLPELSERLQSSYPGDPASQWFTQSLWVPHIYRDLFYVDSGHWTLPELSQFNTLAEFGHARIFFKSKNRLLASHDWFFFRHLATVQPSFVQVSARHELHSISSLLTDSAQPAKLPQSSPSSEMWHAHAHKIQGNIPRLSDDTRQSAKSQVRASSRKYRRFHRITGGRGRGISQGQHRLHARWGCWIRHKVHLSSATALW